MCKVSRSHHHLDAGGQLKWPRGRIFVRIGFSISFSLKSACSLHWEARKREKGDGLQNLYDLFKPQNPAGAISALLLLQSLVCRASFFFRKRERERGTTCVRRP